MIMIDSSMLQCYQECPRKFYYRYILRRKPGVGAMGAEFGEAIHKGLDALWENWALGVVIETFKENWKDLPGDEVRTVQRGVQILTNYQKRWASLRQEMELIGSEIGFKEERVTASGVNYNLVGRIDKIVKWHSQIFALDHKTTKQMGPSFFLGFDPNIQIMNYIRWVKIAFGGGNGLIIDGIKTEAYKDIKRAGDELARDIINVSQDRLDENIKLCDKMVDEIYASAYVNVVQEGKNIWLNYDHLKENPCYSGCEKWGGCSYREVCLFEPKLRERLLEDDDKYMREDWEPLKQAHKIIELTNGMLVTKD